LGGKCTGIKKCKLNAKQVRIRKDTREKLVTKVTEDEQNRVHAEASFTVAETQSHREIQTTLYNKSLIATNCGMSRSHSYTHLQCSSPKHHKTIILHIIMSLQVPGLIIV
jgi:hypothetical protein